MNGELASLIGSALIGELEGLRDQVRELCRPLSDQEFWKKPIESGNSIGHLVLHLTGNLNHFVGAQLGKTGYVRDREREFTQADGPAKSIALDNLDAAVAVFRKVVGNLSAEQLAEAHPEKRFGSVLSTLVHLLAHFALHRGQMSYIQRLVRPSS